VPPPKPPISLAQIDKLRDELQDRARQRVIDRIIHGAKPPDSLPGKPSRPSFGDKPGLGMTLGPGGLRGASSSGTPGPTRR
jgi:hypothetical protein